MFKSFKISIIIIIFILWLLLSSSWRNMLTSKWINELQLNNIIQLGLSIHLIAAVRICFKNDSYQRWPGFTFSCIL